MRFSMLPSPRVYGALGIFQAAFQQPSGYKMKLPPPQLALPVSACAGGEERKEEEKESPGVRCLCSGQVMREIFLSFPKKAKVGVDLGNGGKGSPLETGRQGGDRVVRARREPGAADVLVSSASSSSSLSFPFPRRAVVGRYLWCPALQPLLTQCHTSVRWWRDLLLEKLGSIPSRRSWEMPALLRSANRYLRMKVDHTLDFSSVSLQRSSSRFHK